MERPFLLKLLSSAQPEENPLRGYQVFGGLYKGNIQWMKVEVREGREVGLEEAT